VLFSPGHCDGLFPRLEILGAEECCGWCPVLGDDDAFVVRVHAFVERGEAVKDGTKRFARHGHNRATPWPGMGTATPFSRSRMPAYATGNERSAFDGEADTNTVRRTGILRRRTSGRTTLSCVTSHRSPAEHPRFLDRGAQCPARATAGSGSSCSVDPRGCGGRCHRSRRVR
jgi:hypothetical protein